MDGYWNGLYSGWGWFLWVGIFVLMISSFGNWGYTYRAHRRFEDVLPGKDALDILHERYARGEIGRDEYFGMRADITGALQLKSQSVREMDTGMDTRKRA